MKTSFAIVNIHFAEFYGSFLNWTEGSETGQKCSTSDRDDTTEYRKTDGSGRNRTEGV